jgi:hypothetical protein
MLDSSGMGRTCSTSATRAVAAAYRSTSGFNGTEFSLMILLLNYVELCELCSGYPVM